MKVANWEIMYKSGSIKQMARERYVLGDKRESTTEEN
jgi:hypothetical protein